jgi:hypothetical protein
MRAAVFWLAAGLVFLLAPGDFDTPGMLKSIAFTLFVVLALTPPAVYYAILRALPERVQVSEASVVDVPTEVDRLCTQYDLMGFSRVLTPLRFHLDNEVLLVPMMSDDGVIATVYRIVGKDQAKVAYDVVSMLEGPEASLTTAMDPGAGVLPAPEGTLRQILVDATPEDLVLFHREAIEALRRQGVEAVGVAPTAIPGLIKRSFLRSREKLQEAAVKNTLVAIWRTLTKQNPHLGMLSEQPDFSETCRRLAASARRRPARRIERPAAKV